MIQVTEADVDRLEALLQELPAAYPNAAQEATALLARLQLARRGYPAQKEEA